LNTTTDPTVYYDRLVEDPIEAEQGGLPPIVLEWVRESAEGDHVFSVIDDVTRSRKLMKESRLLARKLKVVLDSSTRAKAFPELKAGLERALGLMNKIGLARRSLAMGLEDVNGSALSGEIGQVRAQRRALMKRMGWLPVTDGDFVRRETGGEQQWNGVSQKLQGLNLEADKLQAIVNGLHRVLSDADTFGVTHDPSSRDRFKAEIEANERDLAQYRRAITQFREAVDIGRAQIGFGDQRYVDDDRIRREFRELFAREVALAASGQAGSDSAGYARNILPILQRADGAEARIDGIRGDLQAQVDRKAGDLQGQVSQESQNIENYASALDGLDENARLLIGEVAMKNFGLVRDRLKSIVLRADVGIVS
jgi:hypothetical protein